MLGFYNEHYKLFAINISVNLHGTKALQNVDKIDPPSWFPKKTFDRNGVRKDKFELNLSDLSIYWESVEIRTNINNRIKSNRIPILKSI